MSLKWYVVHVYSGHEQKVKVALEEKIQGSKHPEKFGDILIPTENVVELVDGKKRESSRKFYPGYILVRMYLDNETWHIVSSTAKVTGFLGGKNKPAPITEKEAQSIIDKMEQGKDKPQPKYFFEPEMKFGLLMGLFPILTGPLKRFHRIRKKLRFW